MDINLTLIGQAIAMAVFVWFCMTYVWPVILGTIEERQNAIADGLAAADKGTRSLEEARVKISGMVEEARGQARQILDQAQTRANGIVDEARVGATQERDRILQSAQADIDQQINRARDELRAQVAAITVAGAEKILAREIDARAHQDLLDKLAAQI
ncbi:MAG: F0F1 ATP synthase subunit B [Gammaproteobacteria bacterium]|nr:F0F1 ATP synthase subunit B [Gammaproteobacteria bacterium]MDH5275632.1 F0F1 ATP synthase subunit B [Gammaproteobacteria bacterium]